MKLITKNYEIYFKHKCPNQSEEHHCVLNFKGYEFDVGIHYIGEVGPGRLNKTLVEQISDGQIEWKKMEDAYDIG